MTQHGKRRVTEELERPASEYECACLRENTDEETRRAARTRVVSTERRSGRCEERMSLLTCQPPVPGSLCGVPPQQVGFSPSLFPKSKESWQIPYGTIFELDFNRLDPDALTLAINYPRTRLCLTIVTSAAVLSLSPRLQSSRPRHEASEMVDCPICGKSVKSTLINHHLDSNCVDHVENEQNGGAFTSSQVTSFFKAPIAKRESARLSSTQPLSSPAEPRSTPAKRPAEESPAEPDVAIAETIAEDPKLPNGISEHTAKRIKPNALQKAAPLAERMRPKTLDEVCGQELVGTQGVLRGLIESDRVPSMILWGGPGTGKTTIARVVANVVGSRFVEINSTSTGVAECKKIFAEARSELSLTGRKTIIFCDEIHRFSKTQQDVFLAPVEAGIVTLIGATTENPSFKVQNALMSRWYVETSPKHESDCGSVV